MEYFYQPGVSTGKHFLDEEESRHCIKVMRCRSGEQISILDGNGKIYQGQIGDANPLKCTFTISSERKISKPNHGVCIAIAPTKNQDRLEWFVEKATEIGITTVRLITCQNVERKKVRHDRLVKKSISAIKQSKNPYLPNIVDCEPIATVIEESQIDNKFIAHVDPDNNTRLDQIAVAGDSLILIGPEGDFTKAEVDHALENGYKKVSLGRNTLRTETAGIVACQILCSTSQ